MTIRKVEFPLNQYYPEQVPKTQIVLHHTVSSNEKSPIDWWKKTPERVATAFVVAKNGVISQIYDPAQWGYHLGKGSTTQQNKNSIGIEIVNEGGITEKNGKFFWLDGKAKYPGKVFDNQTAYRGFRYFAEYTDEQYQATASLSKMLCEMFSIPKDTLTQYDFNKNFFNHKGILSHRNLRPDKTDVSPAWDFHKFEELLNA